MDIFDLIEPENGSKKNKNYNERAYKSNKQHASEFGDIGKIVGSLGNFKKIIPIIIIIGIVLLLLVIGLIVFLWPYLQGAVNYVDQNGVKGVIESGSGVIDRVWNGNGQ